MESLKRLYTSFTGHEPLTVTALPASGSNRRYYRLTGNPTLIGVCGECLEENETYLYLAEHFGKQGLPVPHTVAVSPDRTHYLQEDLGETLLFDAIATGRTTGCFSDEEKELLHKAIQLLPAVQFAGAQELDFNRCHPLPAFNRRSILWDLNYFKYCFLKATGLPFQEDRLEDDFEKVADVLLSAPSESFMYRDFQSRNIMVMQDKLFLIDFQGGRKGPFYYDVASFLWQAKACYPETLRQELLTEYLSALKQYQKIEEAEFYAMLRHFVLFRILQVLGAYGFRGYFERKKHFLESVPFALANLRNLLAEPFAEYPYLSRLLTELSKPEEKKLVVTVMSFSYRKGIPEDTSGNGGGFVFDCRAVHNPGKYDQYKPLTGLDRPVIDFLEKDGEITEFLQNAVALVDASVQRYLERGFTNLTVSFGCTGGRHRSVYSAQHMAEHLKKKFGVEIHLIHREQNIDTTL